MNSIPQNTQQYLADTMIACDATSRLQALLLWEDLVKTMPAHQALATIRRHYGHSTSYWYRWRDRYIKHGVAGLACHSRRPHTLAKKRVWNSTVYSRLCELKKDQRTAMLGAVKLWCLLKKKGLPVPSARTIGRMIAHGYQTGQIPELPHMLKARIKRRSRPLSLYVVRFNPSVHRDLDRVQIDVKYQSITKDYYWYQFSAIHIPTRYSWSRVYIRLTSFNAAKFLSFVMKSCPPNIDFDALQVDGGSEFRGEFIDACKHNNKRLIVNRAYTPTQNAYVERLHRTIDDEFYALTPITRYTCAMINEELQQYLYHYNYHRPHLSLDLRTPYDESIRLAQSEKRAYTYEAQAP